MSFRALPAFASSCSGTEQSTFTGWSSGWYHGPQPYYNVGAYGALTDQNGYVLCPGSSGQENGNSISQWVMVQGAGQAYDYAQVGTVYVFGYPCAMTFMQADDAIGSNQYNGFTTQVFECSQPGQVNLGGCYYTPAPSDNFDCYIGSQSQSTSWGPDLVWTPPYYVNALAEVHYLQDRIAGSSTAPYGYSSLSAERSTDHQFYDTCGEVALALGAYIPNTATNALACDHVQTWEK